MLHDWVFRFELGLQKLGGRWVINEGQEYVALSQKQTRVRSLLLGLWLVSNWMHLWGISGE